MVAPTARGGAVPLTTHDTEPPTVTNTVPANGAVDVSVNQVITVTYSEAMLPGTPAINVDRGGQSVPGNRSYDAPTRTLSFDPTGPMLGDSLHTVTVLGTAKDLAGNPMGSDYVFTFTTEDDQPPTVTATVPTNNAVDVSVNQDVLVTFSEDMAPLTVNTNTFLLAAPSGPVEGSVSYDVPSRTATFVPGRKLRSLTLYETTITQGATDLAGNPLAAPHVFTFTTFPPAGTTIAIR